MLSQNWKPGVALKYILLKTDSKQGSVARLNSQVSISKSLQHALTSSQPKDFMIVWTQRHLRRWALVASSFLLLDGTWGILRTSIKYRFQNVTIYMFHSIRFSEHDTPCTLHVSSSALLQSCKLLDGPGKAFPTVDNAFNTLQDKPKWLSHSEYLQRDKSDL